MSNNFEELKTFVQEGYFASPEYDAELAIEEQAFERALVENFKLL